MRQVRDYPTTNRTIILNTYNFASTGPSGTLTVSGGVDASALEQGQSILLFVGGGSSGGYTNEEEYFIIPSTSNPSGTVQLASSKDNALAGVADTSASGNAGSGTIYPNYAVGGTLYVGNTGNLNIRGIGNYSTGASSFSLHANVSKYMGVANSIPFMIKDVSSSGTTASNFVVWSK